MAEMFKLRVITPEADFYDGDVSMVEFTTTMGNVGIYKNHVPMTAIVAPGILNIHEESDTKSAALISGFAEVLENQVTILADACEWPDEIDENRANEAKLRAERRLKEDNADIDTARAKAALSRALVRLDLKNR